MRRVAEKRQPVESLDNDAENINIDQHHENSADVDVPLEFNDPQVELGPDVGQNTSSEGQTREAPDRRARVEEIEDEEAGVQNRWIEDFQVMRESGVIRHRVILRSCVLNSRSKDYHPGRPSKMRKSGSWLTG
jgi:hypothetical protein